MGLQKKVSHSFRWQLTTIHFPRQRQARPIRKFISTFCLVQNTPLKHGKVNKELKPQTTAYWLRRRWKFMENLFNFKLGHRVRASQQIGNPPLA